jgi:hypothetical protein
LSILRNQPPEALNDFEYVRDHIDPASCLNYLNLTIAYAELGNYAKASNSLEKAIANVRYGQFQGGSEALIPDDIIRATGRTTLTADKETFEAALYYMKANLEAYVGDTDAFRTALNRADEQARLLSPVSQKDAYFIAMTWAWLHLRARCPDSGVACKDYGALISEAKLWERAGYPQWAACYYQKFQDKDQDKRWADRRYVSLGKLVGQSTPLSCQSLEEREPDVLTLEIEAKEARARKDFPKAKELLDKALDKAPERHRIHLLLEKAEVLLEIGRAEKRKLQLSEFIAELAEFRVKRLNEEKEAEENRAQQLATKEASDWKKKLGEKYAPKIAEAQKLQANAEAEAKQYDQKAKDAFLALKDDCDQTLKKDRRAAVAYYYRALAQYLLGPDSLSSKKTVLGDLDKALRIEPAYEDALGLLDALVSPTESQGDAAYLERYRGPLERYWRMSPYWPETFTHKAKLANKEMRYAEALQSIEVAIGMKPEDLSLYDIRADAERGLGINESQVKRNLADGYRQAGDVLKRRGDVSEADDAYRKGWEVLAKLAKNHQNEEIRCDSNVTTCNFTKIVEANSERIYSGILSVGKGGGAVREARIDKGSEDGIVVGAQGDIWSIHSQGDDGHERKIMKLGTGDVLSVEPDSALVRINMDSPSGDGLVREHDCLEVNARTPPHPKDSRLWALAKYNITVKDMNNKKIMDYRTMYSGKDPELENALLQTMLGDIRESGGLYDEEFAKQVLKGKTTIGQGAFKGKTPRQALESASLEDLRRSLDYAAKYPGEFFGQTWETSVIYLTWVLAGTPSE